MQIHGQRSSRCRGMCLKCAYQEQREGQGQGTEEAERLTDQRLDRQCEPVWGLEHPGLGEMGTHSSVFT